MTKMPSNKIFLKKEYFFYLFLYSSLLIAFFFEENATRGAEYDSNIIFTAVKSFSTDFSSTFQNYEKFTIAHYPFYYIFLSQILKLSGSITFTKIVLLHLNLLLPFVFFKIIKLTYGVKNKYLIYLPGIIFLSPGFRASSIWGLNDNIALIFFSLSILFFLKFTQEKNSSKKIVYVIMNVAMLAMAAYTRQYYAIFSIYFFYKFLEGRNIKITAYYIISSLILASYAIWSTISGSNMNYSFNFLTNNISNNIAVTVTIFIIYLIPFILNKEIIFRNIEYYNKYKIIFLLNILFTSVIYYFFDYNLPYGGGIIYKITYHLSHHLYFLVFFVSTLVILNFLSHDYNNNTILFFCILLAFPAAAIYQKYLDPLAILLIVSLFKNSYVKKFMGALKFNIKYIYLYFFFIYTGSMYYNLILR